MNIGVLEGNMKVTYGVDGLPLKDVNKVILLGTLETEPSLAYTVKNIPITKFVVITKETRLNIEGDVVEEKVKHRIVVPGRQAEYCSDYLRKGDRVSIAGRIKTRFKEIESGRKVFVTEVIGSEIELLK